MRFSKSLAAAAMAALGSALIVLGCVSVPSAQAETRITVPGAGPLYYPHILTALPFGRFYLLGTDEQDGPPLSILEGYDLLNHVIGKNWFPGSTAQVVNYPASIGLLSASLAAPGADEAVAMGRASLDDQIMNAAAGGDRVVIAGLSEGTIVINRELAYLAGKPGAPPANLLSFVLFSGPEPGLVKTYFPPGWTVPIVDYTVHGMADSQYDVSIVFHQYDGWADPPDRPWNLLAVVNAFVGSLYFHNNAALAVPSDAVELSSVTSDLGGTTTTYMIPSSTLPILKPLQQLGFPTQLVDGLNSVLKPIVDAGYSSLSPNAGPYFSHGQLLGLPPPFGSPSTAPARVEASTADANLAQDSTSAQLSTSPRAAADPSSQTLAARPVTPKTAEVPSGATVEVGHGRPDADTVPHVTTSPTGTTLDGPVATTTSDLDHDRQRIATPGDDDTSPSTNGPAPSGSTDDATHSGSDGAASTSAAA